MTIDELNVAFQGDVLRPGDPDYDEARTVWNAMIDKRPALIFRVRNTQDVVRAVNYAREHRLALSVKGGGHNIAGSAVVSGGAVIDLTYMRSVRVDHAARRVVVEGGATLAELDAATQAHGLAVPVGINSTTGIGGLTLGGGFGWLSRKYGMTVDNLESVEIVTADGRVLKASIDQNPDLFWAIRGGSGNFGVVTRFEFRLHPVGPELLSGLVAYPLAQAKAVLAQYRTFVAHAPDELSVWAVMRKAPPLPFLPAAAHGTDIVVLAFLHAGDPGAGKALTAPLLAFGTPLGAHVGVQPYAAWQQTFDPLLTKGARNYWKSHNLAHLSDGLIDAAIEAAANVPSPATEIFIASLGGAASRPAVDSAAYPHRDAHFVMNVHGRWEDATDDARGIRWARTFFDATAPFASGGVYVNFMTDDESGRVRAAYGANYDRLARIKRAFDPQNLFRSNQNIAPAA